MRHKRGMLSAGLALVLAACGQSGTQSPEAVQGPTAGVHEPEILGVVQVEFQHIGQADFSVNATVVPSSVTAQTLARTGSVSFTQGTRGSFTGPDHVRYLYGQLNVNNTGAARSNLTLLGINAHVPGGFQSLGDTSLAAASRANGVPLTALEARKVWPLHRRNLVGGAVQVVNDQADFQAYPEAAITPAIANFMAASPYNGYAFPFGFVARSKTNANTRIVPTGTAAGTVTLAFRYPDENPATTSDDLSSFTWYGLITTDTQDQVTADAQEVSAVRACAAAQAFYPAGGLVAVVGSTTPASCPPHTTVVLGDVRTAGPASVPTAGVPNTPVVGGLNLDRTVPLGGVDLNANQIRDDLEGYIAGLTLSDLQKNLLRHYLQAVQRLLQDAPPTADQAFAGAQALNVAQRCVSETFGVDDTTLQDDLFAYLLDTPQRLDAYLRFEHAIGGQVILEPDTVDCGPLQSLSISTLSLGSLAATPSTCNVSVDYAIAYFNGIDNTFLQAGESILKLRSMYGSSYNGKTLRYRRFYNPTDGLLTDLKEVFQQHAAELNGRWELFMMMVNGNSNIFSYVALLGLRSEAVSLTLDAFSTRIAQKLSSTDPNTAQIVSNFTTTLKGLLSEGTKVLGVGHSQGNFFLNSVYDQIQPTLAGRRSFLTLHVGVPTATVHGPVFTYKEDAIISALRALTGNSIPAGNYEFGLGSGAVGVAQRIVKLASGYDFALHGFVKTYTNPHSETAALIRSAGLSQLAALEDPVTDGNPGLFTVVLTWNGSGDVDLHVFEPNTSHVFYANKVGTSGELDVDNVDANGPEHYYASCDPARVQQGLFHVGINNYAQATGRTATVQLLTRTRVYPPVQLNVGPARGSSGNDSPLPVFDIQVATDQTGALVVTQH